MIRLIPRRIGLTEAVVVVLALGYLTATALNTQITQSGNTVSCSNVVAQHGSTVNLICNNLTPDQAKMLQTTIPQLLEANRKQLAAIKALLETRNKPQAELQFTFLPLKPHEGMTDTIQKQIVDGVVSVELTAKNKGPAQADNGQIWIQICDECRFAAEPAGSTMPPDDPVVRRKRFDALHTGSYFESTSLKIIPPTGIASFSISLKYACEACPPIDNDHPQKLRVDLVDASK